ncbi:2-phospho-L-lactate guanylyltransferase [uncultured Cohaesibacter sp.]|uniref:2-phospho-L-lactate guanylyltransferase n=1 Tax=uncultured Cohaesibacter sp. TaxID=1002546 RepID=UPI0029C89FEF|nr:2-phospho-L-lactate guanylyltransferase [uncultured Cohaesibacter sp.]
MIAHAKKCLLAIPMKDPLDAKTRLSISLNQAERARLAMALFLNVVECAKEALANLPDSHIDIGVISSSETIRELSSGLDIKWIDDGGAPTLSIAVERAATIAQDEGYDILCVLPGDLADPSHKDIMQLLDYPQSARDAVICPSGDLGTNALLVPLPCPIEFSYGDRSFHRHYRASVEAGLVPVILPLLSLRRDVDTVHDWHDLQRRRPDVAFWSNGR